MPTGRLYFFSLEEHVNWKFIPLFAKQKNIFWCSRGIFPNQILNVEAIPTVLSVFIEWNWLDKQTLQQFEFCLLNIVTLFDFKSKNLNFHQDSFI